MNCLSAFYISLEIFFSFALLIILFIIFKSIKNKLRSHSYLNELKILGEKVIHDNTDRIKKFKGIIRSRQLRGNMNICERDLEDVHIHSFFRFIKITWLENKQGFIIFMVGAFFCLCFTLIDLCF